MGVGETKRGGSRRRWKVAKSKLYKKKGSGGHQERK